jgi:hypothetical protein
MIAPANLSRITIPPLENGELAKFLQNSSGAIQPCPHSKKQN